LGACVVVMVVTVDVDVVIVEVVHVLVLEVMVVVVPVLDVLEFVPLAAETRNAAKELVAATPEVLFALMSLAEEALLEPETFVRLAKDAFPLIVAACSTCCSDSSGSSTTCRRCSLRCNKVSSRAGPVSEAALLMPRFQDPASVFASPAPSNRRLAGITVTRASGLGSTTWNATSGRASCFASSSFGKCCFSSRFS